MRQDEDGHMVGWVVAPPALPVRVGPGTTNRSEHVPPENPRADVLESPCGVVIVDTGRTIAGAMDTLEGARRNKPLVQVCPAHAERIVDVRIRPGSVSVN